MKKLFILSAIIVFYTQMGLSQMQINWQQSFGGMNQDYAFDLSQTEGGYLVMGATLSSDGQVECNTNGGSTLWLLKINNSGNLIWQRCYENEDAYRIAKAIDSPDYYLVGGTKSEPYPDDYNLWIAKIDSLGNIIWDRTLGNTIGILGGDQYGEATADGGVIATAQIDSKGGDITNWWGGYDGWIIKLDSAGNTEWDFSVGSSQFEFINCIIQSSDYGYLAGLYGTPNGIGGNVDCDIQSFSNPDAILFKLDTNGNPEWHHCYGGSGHDGVVRLLETANGYMVAAFGGSNDGDLTGSGWHGDVDVWLIRTDFSGDIIWQKCYGGSNHDSPLKIFQTSDGGFVVFANTYSFDGDVVGNPSWVTNPSIWVFKVDGNGELLWQQCIGGPTKEEVYSAVQLGDYNYTVAGTMTWSPSGDVNCSNFVNGSQRNYWIFGISDTIVEVDEPTEKLLDVRVYPNPSSDQVTFEIPDQHSSYPITQINIQNIFGQIVDIISINQDKANGGSSYIWHAAHFSSGLYLYSIRTENSIQSGKIILAK